MGFQDHRVHRDHRVTRVSQARLAHEARTDGSNMKMELYLNAKVRRDGGVAQANPVYLAMTTDSTCTRKKTRRDRPGKLQVVPKACKDHLAMTAHPAHQDHQVTIQCWGTIKMASHMCTHHQPNP